MGHCRKILGFKIVEPIATFYSDLFAIELAENFHVHLRNLRLELDHVEFERLARGFAEALRAWQQHGRVATQRYEVAGDRFLKLHTSKIQPIPSQWNPNTSNDELRVELQQWADYVHVHYRQLRLEYTVQEFLDFASTIEEAKRTLQAQLAQEENPKRVGKFHRANPDGRVESTGGPYWTKPPQWDRVSARPYASNYIHPSDGELKGDRGRDSRNPALCSLDISDLYDITVYHAAALHPWMVDAQGVCRPLVARYDFAKMALAAGGSPTMEQIRQTEYWELLGRPLSATPRDGSSDWIYADREAQCRRFLALIRSLAERGYTGLGQDGVPAAFDGDRPIRILRNGVVEEVLKHKDGGLPGMITVRPVAGAYCVWNGLHRIAILKCLWNQGRLLNNRILVRKTTGASFGPDDWAPASQGPNGAQGRAGSFILRWPMARRLGSKVLTRFPRLRALLRPSGRNG